MVTGKFNVLVWLLVGAVLTCAMADDGRTADWGTPADGVLTPWRRDWGPPRPVPTAPLADPEALSFPGPTVLASSAAFLRAPIPTEASLQRLPAPSPPADRSVDHARFTEQVRLERDAPGDTARPWDAGTGVQFAGAAPPAPPAWPGAAVEASSLLSDEAVSAINERAPVPAPAPGTASPCEPGWPGTVRVGWWSTSLSGSPIKVGEFQNLGSSPFLSVDQLFSNGKQTLDLSFAALDDDASQLGLRYIGPRISAAVDFQNYLRRLDRDPLAAFVDFDKQPAAPLPAAPANFRDMKEDLSVGEDFAIRVEQLRSNVSGRLTKNVNWRINFWAMRKHGERQVTAMAHCFTASNATDVNGNPVGGVACHVLSQTQRIDWVTAEVEPGLTGRWGPVSVDYSRTVRSLTTDDQSTTRPYDNFGFTGDQPYAVVPENLTQIDRLKVGMELAQRRSVYGRLFHGNTENRFRDTNRRFRGYDLRLTDRSLDSLSVTCFAKGYVQSGQTPNSLLNFESPGTIRAPIGYDRTSLGIRWRWQPLGTGSPGAGPRLFDSPWRGLSFSGGYEYKDLDRSNALFVERVLAVEQSSTTANVAHVRAAMKWSPRLDSFLGYRVGLVTDPLYGVPIGNTSTNTSLPTEEHLIEFGTTWAPVDSLLLSVSLGINNSANTSSIATFQEDNDNLVFSGWYAPTPRWTLSGGLAFYANWTDQEITLGSKSTAFTAPWSFAGRSDVVNVGTTYAWTDAITLSGTYEFVRASNIAYAPDPYADLPPLSNVIAETSRFLAGVDYQLREGVGVYMRYQFFDYDARTQAFNSGTSKMLLFGAAARY